MSNHKKDEVVARLAEKLVNNNMVILTDYRGLSVTEITELRKRLREVETDFRVTKNTMTRFAIQKVSMGDLDPFLVGPTAIAFVLGELAPAAKVLSDYERTSSVFTIKGGFLEGQVITAEDVKTVAQLPPMPTLKAKLLGNMQAPMGGLLSIMSGALGGFLRVMTARAEQSQTVSSN
jgi:large subunit ribosomal protein L10